MAVLLDTSLAETGGRLPVPRGLVVSRALARAVIGW
jgi:hypothetical protein